MRYLPLLLASVVLLSLVVLLSGSAAQGRRAMVKIVVTLLVMLGLAGLFALAVGRMVR